MYTHTLKPCTLLDLFDARLSAKKVLVGTKITGGVGKGNYT